MKPYDHTNIEKRWQKEWERRKLYKADDHSPKPTFYGLIEFPFPSGDGMHTGHLRSNTAMDIIARKRRAEGFNVLYPIGWDAFGLPTENYAIKTGMLPQKVTKINTDNFRRQLKSAGFSFDWSREINTSDPAYYKWTQWIFLQFYKQGLAYKKKMAINWCPKDKIGLANEEVVDGKCERCGTAVEKREKDQWMLAITKYADRLDKDLDTVDYVEKIKVQQRNWIGRSEGAHLDFAITGTKEKIKVFTTRPDTLFGATYLVLAPEHKLVKEMKDKISNWSEVEQYVAEVSKKSDIERSAEGKAKFGVELKGITAVNPGSQEEIPIWIAEYVLADYGTGAIMAVPAYDERDFEFAKKYSLPVKEVELRKDNVQAVGGEVVTSYKLRDWVFSRQRYWGEPIPMIHCADCGWVPVPEKDLPVKLPKVKNYLPTDTGESPLAVITKWVNTKCPKCRGKAKRETDTMPNWAGSSWYYLRFADPKNKKVFASPEKLEQWTPVDWYNGGMEHTTLHVLYSRFWHKFLYDLKLVPTSEPYQKRTSHGLILAGGGVKMSKSLGNVVNPDAIIEHQGADTLRLYEMFAAPFDQPFAWSEDGVVGPRRFLERVWRLQEKVVPKLPFDAALESVIHKTIKKVSEDIERMSFNTAVSALMILVNEMEERPQLAQGYYEHMLQLLAPFAPHITEELWNILGHKQSIGMEKWLISNPSKIQEASLTIVVQINGKMRAQFEMPAGATEAEITHTGLHLEATVRWIEGREVRKVVYVPGKLLNIVV